MKKIMMRGTALALVLVMLCGMASASTVVTPRADSMFSSASAYLGSDGWVTISCTTFWQHTTIRIVSIWSEYKEDGVYYHLSDLANATYTVHDTTTIGKEYDCTSILGTGTIRIGFRVMCDGYYINRYSNDVTFR